MTIAEKLRNEGKQEGLKEGIEIVLNYKFPKDIDMIMALVNKVEDLDTLNKVKAALKTSKDKAEILALIGDR